MTRVSTTKKKKNFLIFYRKYNFDISKACRETGISRWTFYSWKEKDRSFQKKLHEAEEEEKDMYEKALKLEALRGNPQLLKFLAETKMKDRGYGREQTIKHEGSSVSFTIESENDKYPTIGDKGKGKKVQTRK